MGPPELCGEPGNKGPLSPQSREGGPPASDLGEAEGQEAVIHPRGTRLEGAGLGAVRAQKPGSLPHTPSHEAAFPRRGTRAFPDSPRPRQLSRGFAALPGKPPVLPSGCLPAGLWGRFRTLTDLRLCLWEGGWAGEAATIVSVQPSVRAGCPPRGASAAWLPPAGRRAASPAFLPGPLSSRPCWKPALGMRATKWGWPFGDHRGCLARAQGRAGHPVGAQ